MTLSSSQPLRNVVPKLKGYGDGHPPVAMTFGGWPPGAALYPKISQLFARRSGGGSQPLYNQRRARHGVFVQRTGDDTATGEERTE